MKYLALSVLALAGLFVANADATDCRIVPIRHNYRAAAVVVDHHAAYSHYAAPYSIGYAPDLTEIVKLLIEDNKQMREALVLQLKAGGGPVTLPLKATRHPGLATMENRCAKCHTDGSAKGGFTMFTRAGEFIDTPIVKEKAFLAINGDPENNVEPTMPKDGKLAEGLRMPPMEVLRSTQFLTVSREPEPKK
jgi:mono/diheme cytochrome c family protein